MSGSQVRTLYFGAIARPGHHLRLPSGAGCSPSDFPRFPWNYAHLDGGLLQIMKQRDVYDGEVVSVERDGWWAFVWWDRSCDTRVGSNSGFYVYGFGMAEDREAFAHAKLAFPTVVTRQLFPLVLK